MCIGVYVSLSCVLCVYVSLSCVLCVYVSLSCVPYVYWCLCWSELCPVCVLVFMLV